jgi:NADH-quinone oxidoreductase subunit A
MGPSAEKGAQRMQYAFLPVFLFVVCTFALAVGLLIVAGLINPGHPGRVSRMPYESGMDPIHDTRRRFDVRFHLLAIAFLVFDVELLFLYPWAVAMSGEGRVESRELRGERGEERGERRGMGTSVPIQSAEKSQIKKLKSQISNLKSQIPAEGIDAAVANGLVENRHLVFGGAMTFLFLLTLGFIYDWRKGIFRWR